MSGASDLYNGATGEHRRQLKRAAFAYIYGAKPMKLPHWFCPWCHKLIEAESKVLLTIAREAHRLTDCPGRRKR
jgi:hypothetical protein